MPPAKRVTQENPTEGMPVIEDRPEDPDSVVTRPSDLGFGPREIEVDAVQEVGPRHRNDDGQVTIRMTTNLEEFTYGNPHHKYDLKEGHRYVMPVEVAHYLYSLGHCQPA